MVRVAALVTRRNPLNPCKLWFFIQGVGAPLHIRPVQCCPCLCDAKLVPTHMVCVFSELSAYYPSNLIHPQ
jgi:hypothetical protein